MKIVILGAGQVGGTLAEHLASESNDITLVDIDGKRLRELQSRLDIRTVEGQASHPNILRNAGLESADMLIAVTSSDETNMLACQIAQVLFQTPSKIARIRSTDYLAEDGLFHKAAIPVDLTISPEQLVTKYVQRLIEFPGALQVLDFADGQVELIAVQPYYGGPLVGKTILQLNDYLPDVELRVVALYRNNRSITISPETHFEVGDEVFVLASPANIQRILQALGRLDNPYKRIIIAGGGNIGFRLAQALEQRYQVKLIERNGKRTESLAQHLDNVVVLHGDASDRDLLINENIEYTDVFCAVTNDDEANIMACLQAKRLGARQVMALINRTPYVDLVEGNFVDVIISPQLATIGTILKSIRQGDVVNLHSLRRGAAEAIEVIAHGDEQTSKVVGRKIREVALPKGTRIGAVVHQDQVIISDDEAVIQAGDQVILFVENKQYIHEVERLFAVSLGFFS